MGCGFCPERYGCPSLWRPTPRISVWRPMPPGRAPQVAAVSSAVLRLLNPLVVGAAVAVSSTLVASISHIRAGHAATLAVDSVGSDAESAASPRTIVAMTGAARPAQTARGHLARLVAVVAVLAGLALAVGLQCTDGMAMPMAHAATSATAATDCGPPATMAADHRPGHVVPADTGPPPAACPALDMAGTFASAHDGASGTHDLGGLLATCLAFLIAAVTAVAVLRPAVVRGVVRMLPPVRVAVIRAVRPRAPNLAELCVLRA